MDQYDPASGPDPIQWLELDESERFALVERFLLNAEKDVPEPAVHAAVHVVVENQIAGGEEPVPATVERLMEQGLDRHEALHAVGAVVAEEAFGVLQGNGGEWNPERFRKRLQGLTAKRWMQWQW